MQSEGPYKETKLWTGNGASTIEGPGFESLPQKVFKDLDMVVLLNLAYAEGGKAERERCHAIASRDVEVVDNVSGLIWMVNPNCSCAKDIMAET